MTKKEEITRVIEKILNQEVDEETIRKRIMVLSTFLKVAMEEKDNIMQDLAIMLKADIANKGGKLLQNAILTGDVEKIILLIKAGVKVTAKNDFGKDNWAIELASCEGKTEAVKLLIINGADINAGLSVAAENGQKDVVKFLIENGADVTANDNRAVKEAFDGGHKEVVELLIKAGASFS